MTDRERDQYLRDATPLECSIEGIYAMPPLMPKVFKSGAIGWYASGKVHLDGTKFQLSICMTAVGTKRVVDDNASAGEQKHIGPESPQDRPDQPLGIFDRDTQLPAPNASNGPPRGKKPGKPKS